MRKLILAAVGGLVWRYLQRRFRPGRSAARRWR
jgi:hypothetical protein